jgi:CRISPR-associated protein Csb2
MFAIEVEFLCGRYAATAHNDRNLAEWPPHPARFFSALVAAVHENEPVDPMERDALFWLEQQSPPSLNVDLEANGDVGRREVSDVYVPVNDVTLVGDVEKPLRDARSAVAVLEAAPKSREVDGDLKTACKTVEKEEKKLKKTLDALRVAEADPSDKDIKTAAALLPDRRTRQVRTFPVAIPAHSAFTMIWPQPVPGRLRPALDRLCERVTRFGHSSSLVRCAIIDQPPAPTLVPDDDGDLVLRTIGPGQLERLETEYARHQAVESRVLPARPQRYAPPPSAKRPQVRFTSALAGEWITFERTGGARPLSSRGTDLARALRGALLEQHGAKDLPGWLSGHGGDGGPMVGVHLAFVALPFVGNQHADASVQGCAIVLPAALPAAERERLLRLIAEWEKRAIDTEVELASGSLPVVRFRRVEVPSKTTLRQKTWAGPARRFVTATPIALDRNPGNLRSNQGGTAQRAAIEAQRSIADACERIGLPRPLSVEVSLSPLLPGAQPVRAFLPWPGRPGRVARTRVHADIVFPEAVGGPVILGAGRFFGLGLCLPVSEGATP